MIYSSYVKKTNQPYFTYNIKYKDFLCDINLNFVIKGLENNALKSFAFNNLHFTYNIRGYAMYEWDFVYIDSRVLHGEEPEMITIKYDPRTCINFS